MLAEVTAGKRCLMRDTTMLYTPTEGEYTDEAFELSEIRCSPSCVSTDMLNLRHLGNGLYPGKRGDSLTSKGKKRSIPQIPR